MYTLMDEAIAAYLVLLGICLIVMCFLNPKYFITDIYEHVFEDRLQLVVKDIITIVVFLPIYMGFVVMTLIIVGIAWFLVEIVYEPLCKKYGKSIKQILNTHVFRAKTGEQNE